MRKEAILAIIAGITIGIFAAYGAYKIKKPEANPSSGVSSTNINSDQTPNPDSLTLSLTQPQQNSVITQSPTAITGISKSKATIVVSAENQDYITQVQEDGTFSQQVDLTAGANQIKIFSFDQTGQKLQEDLLIVYSTEFKAQEETQETPPDS